jgi:hypothetical protein
VLIAFDRDDAGERGAPKVAERLLAEGIDCFRIQFPKGMDANAYALKVQPAAKSLGLAIRKAVGSARAFPRRVLWKPHPLDIPAGMLWKPTDRPSRGLRSVQGRSGHGKPRAGLRCGGFNRHRSRMHCIIREGTTQATSGIEPVASRPAAGGKCYAFNITAHYAKCRQSPTELAWCRHRSGGCATSAPCGFA